ncbi:MAG TPA: hypothetical protein VFG68_12455 [Fimbriiglobus sp.]|nr:hypothetical protein [Fimbriiglobus sp.]
MSAIDNEPCLSGAVLWSPWDWNRTGWGIARVAVLGVTVALVVALVAWPTVALRVLWDLLIPILPASFLIAPHLWRGVCPLATLNQWSSGLLGRRQLNGRLLIAANALGILLLVLLVPARRFVFNENGPALAAAIAAVAVLALTLGALFGGRAGFCNAVCPVLPVERLYGQHPFRELDNRRCDRCTVCIPKGCLDLDPIRSFAHAIGREAGRHRWLTTTYGVFAAALPGFIVGYYTLANVPWTEAAGVYLWVALCSAGSYLVAMVVVRAFGLTRPVGLALLAASAVALYYWWAAPLIAGLLGVPAVVGRAAALALVAVWLVRAWPRLRAGRGKVGSGSV